MKVLSENKVMERTVNSMAACKKNQPSQTIVHAQLEMTKPGDADENEANAMADAIVSDGKIRRQISNGTSGSGIAVSTAMESQLAQAQGGGRTMPDGLRNMMETGFGRDFSNVRIHTDSQAAEMNSTLSAKAFTLGNDIYFNKGQFAPNTTEGQHLVAHELTHVVQGSGKVGRETDNTEKQNLADLIFNITGALIDVFSVASTARNVIETVRETEPIVELLKGIRIAVTDAGYGLKAGVQSGEALGNAMQFEKFANMPTSKGGKILGWAGLAFALKDLFDFVKSNKSEYSEHIIGMSLCTTAKAFNVFCSAVGCFPKLASKLPPKAIAFFAAYGVGYAIGDYINVVFDNPAARLVDYIMDGPEVTEEDVIDHKDFVLARIKFIIEEETQKLDLGRKREMKLNNSIINEFFHKYRRKVIEDQDRTSIGKFVFGSNAGSFLKDAFVYHVYRKDLSLSYTDYYLLKTAFHTLGLW
ncbi:MAG: DUF4157 domain-containing protein [Paludibacteraceae bacterium]|nr:DUF4157 domain-containing protein [Paludibacteraceae bacterium]